MKPTNFNPAQLGPAVGFSHATVAGRTMWTGGQIGSDESGRIVEPRDITAQFGRALENLAIALRAAGFAPSGVVKLTYYVTDIDLYRANRRAIGEAYRAVMGTHFPASTLVQVQALFEPDALVEIEAVAIHE